MIQDERKERERERGRGGKLRGGRIALVSPCHRNFIFRDCYSTGQGDDRERERERERESVTINNASSEIHNNPIFFRNVSSKSETLSRASLSIRFFAKSPWIRFYYLQSTFAWKWILLLFLFSFFKFIPDPFERYTIVLQNFNNSS